MTSTIYQFQLEGKEPAQLEALKEIDRLMRASFTGTLQLEFVAGIPRVEKQTHTHHFGKGERRSRG